MGRALLLCLWLCVAGTGLCAQSDSQSNSNSNSQNADNSVNTGAEYGSDSSSDSATGAGGAYGSSKLGSQSNSGSSTSMGGSPFGGDGKLGDFSNLDASCLDFRVYYYCYPTDKLLISHYYPVALIELIRTPGDFFKSDEAQNEDMASRTKLRVQNGYEVRIWDIGPMVDDENQCMLCTSQEAQLGKAMENISLSSFSELGPKLNQMGKELNDEASKNGNSCGPSPEQIKEKIDEFNESSDIDLFYTTELDIINWRTGCRDMKDSALLSNMKCFIEDLSNDSDSKFDGEMAAFQDDDKDCMGAWGSVKPRQYRSVNTEIVSAAANGWKALHISNFDLENFKYYFGKGAKLQHAHPKLSSCFRPGKSAIFVEKDTFSSSNGNYAFIYWVQVFCCRSMGETQQCQQWQQNNMNTSGGKSGGGGFGGFGGIK